MDDKQGYVGVNGDRDVISKKGVESVMEIGMIVFSTKEFLTV